MPSSAKMLALAAAASTATAFQGFNYGATYDDGRLKVEQDFLNLFKTAQGLEGTDGKFNSARLYTMIQGNTDNQPISAIPAAIKTKTSILFGLWASAGDASFNNEITALQNTIDQYCDQLDGLVAGISVGSEDLYRDSPIGIEAGENPGVGPSTLVGYIKKVRETIKGTCLSDAPIGHVDTWTAYVNGTNQPLIEACDWVGMDAYPYFENTKPNAIGEAKDLFNQALENTKGVSGDKPVWITETGYPVAGKTSGDAVANAKNARTYWEDVGCPLFGNVNTWWYTLQDSNSDAPSDQTPSFGVVGDDLSTTPRYNLSCKGVSTAPESSSSTSTPATSKTASAGTETKTKASATETQSESKTESETGTKAVETASELATASASASGLTTVTPPASTATSTSGSGSDSGSDSGSGSGSGSDSTGAAPTPVPTDAGAHLNKGSFGAVVVALALTFFAL